MAFAAYVAESDSLIQLDFCNSRLSTFFKKSDCILLYLLLQSQSVILLLWIL